MLKSGILKGFIFVPVPKVRIQETSFWPTYAPSKGAYCSFSMRSQAAHTACAAYPFKIFFKIF